MRYILRSMAEAGVCSLAALYLATVPKRAPNCKLRRGKALIIAQVSYLREVRALYEGDADSLDLNWDISALIRHNSKDSICS